MAYDYKKIVYDKYGRPTGNYRETDQGPGSNEFGGSGRVSGPTYSQRIQNARDTLDRIYKENQEAHDKTMAEIESRKSAAAKQGTESITAAAEAYKELMKPYEDDPEAAAKDPAVQAAKEALRQAITRQEGLLGPKTIYGEVAPPKGGLPKGAATMPGVPGGPNPGAVQTLPGTGGGIKPGAAQTLPSEGGSTPFRWNQGPTVNSRLTMGQPTQPSNTPSGSSETFVSPEFGSAGINTTVKGPGGKDVKVNIPSVARPYKDEKSGKLVIDVFQYDKDGKPVKAKMLLSEARRIKQAEIAKKSGIKSEQSAMQQYVQ